jgi:hypothetical protein
MDVSRLMRMIVLLKSILGVVWRPSPSRGQSHNIGKQAFQRFYILNYLFSKFLLITDS